jgi:hypothetical protein
MWRYPWPYRDALYCIVLYCMVVRRQSGYMKVEGRPLMQLPEQAAFRHLQP